MSLAILGLKWVIDSFYGGGGGVHALWVCAKRVYKFCGMGLTLRLWKYGEMPHFDIFLTKTRKPMSCWSFFRLILSFGAVL